MTEKKSVKTSPKPKVKAVVEAPQELTELQMLRLRLEELEKKESQQVASSNYAPSRSEKINQDDYIPVMSLMDCSLNLSTKLYGQGDIKKFTKFGEIKPIMYRDLTEILETNKNFLEAGYFYIMHPGVIRQHGLDEMYSKILTKEKIEEILSTESENCISLYQSANEKQQEMIIRALVDRLIENPESLNLNIVDKLSRLSKVNIAEKAETAREEFEDRKVEAKERGL